MINKPELKSAVEAVREVVSSQPVGRVFQLGEAMRSITNWYYSASNISVALKHYRDGEDPDLGVQLFTIHGIGHVLLQLANFDENGFIMGVENLVGEAIGMAEGQIVEDYYTNVGRWENILDFDQADIFLIDSLLHTCLRQDQDRLYELTPFFRAAEMYVLARIISGGGYASFVDDPRMTTNNARVQIYSINEKLQPYQLGCRSITYGLTDFGIQRIMGENW